MQVNEGSSVYASAIANRVIDVMDTQYAAGLPHISRLQSKSGTKLSVSIGTDRNETFQKNNDDNSCSKNFIGNIQEMLKFISSIVPICVCFFLFGTFWFMTQFDQF